MGYSVGIFDEIDNRAQFWVVLVCPNPAITVGKADADGSVQKCLNASSGSRELIRFMNCEIPRSNMDASLVDLGKNLSGGEGWDTSIETKVIRGVREFVSELVPQTEASCKFKR